MQNIISYITDKYNPLCIVVYGSYADDTYNPLSDFDCMIIVANKAAAHDTSVVDGVQLDLFIHSTDEVDLIDCTPFFYAKIIKDTNDIAKGLVNKAKSYITNKAKKTILEKDSLKSWLCKMLARAKSDNADGLFRRHWALTDSLEIYFDLRDKFYFGPKKAIATLRNDDVKGFQLFDNTLRSMDYNDFEEWIKHVVANTDQNSARKVAYKEV